MGFKPVVDFNKCTGCGVCSSVCPADVYGPVKDGKTQVLKPAECIGCRACESQCSENAIQINEE